MSNYVVLSRTSNYHTHLVRKKKYLICEFFLSVIDFSGRPFYVSSNICNFNENTFHSDINLGNQCFVLK